MAQIICLANSFKGGGQRCIAGIDIDTGEWVRPFNPRRHEGALGRERLIKDDEPRILDVLDIPIGEEAKDYGCQPENRILEKGRWKRISHLKPEDLLDYCEDDSVILHNDQQYVTPDFFSQKPMDEWKSLQLIHSTKVRFTEHSGGRGWRVYFAYGRNKYLDLKLTDVDISNRLRNNERISNECILTISLASPWKPNAETPELCYKVVAGVVEL